MNNSTNIALSQSDMIGAITGAEIDMQIATAKRYPRDINRSLANITAIATLDFETAEECFYSLRRGSDIIDGLSVRFAEIVASNWGNLRVATRIIGNDGKTVTCQGVAFDLETNFATSSEVKRRITDKTGKTFSEDMQVLTASAGSAIAFRNAVLKVVPKGLLRSVINQVKEKAMNKPIPLAEQITQVVRYFRGIGVTEAQLCAYLEIVNINLITPEMIFELRGVANAIKAGQTTVQECFVNAEAEAKKQAEAVKKAKTAQEKAAAAMAMSSENVQQPTNK